MNEEEAICSRCGQPSVMESCPYMMEINNATAEEAMCDCCADCGTDCQEDI